jgi:hypothetical protein
VVSKVIVAMWSEVVFVNQQWPRLPLLWHCAQTIVSVAVIATVRYNNDLGLCRLPSFYEKRDRLERSHNIVFFAEAIALKTQQEEGTIGHVKLQLRAH